MKNTDWDNLVPHGISGEREESPRTLRFPKQLALDVIALAKERGTDFTTTALYLIQGAMTEVKASSKKRASPRLKRAS